MRFVTDILAKANLVVDGSVTLNTTANASVDTDKFLVQDGTVVKYRTGSEVLSDIGAQGALTLTTTGTSGPATLVGNTLNIPQYQAVLTNPITGTGVSGQVAYFNGTTSITGESNLFWDASNDRLGIGTSTPQYSLDSTGVINSTGFGTFLGFSTPPGRTYNYVTSFGSGTTINYPGTGTLGFQYNYFANNEFYTTAGGTSNLLIVGFRNQNYIRSTVSTVPFQMVGFNNRFDMHDANDLATLGILNGVNSGFLREATASSLGGITTAYQFTATTRLRSGFYTTTRWGNENLQVADTTASQASTITDYDFLLNTTNVGSSSGGPGTITNFYLLRHVTNIGATGTITNRWGLYLTDSSFKSYHAGNFLIGTNSDPGFKLYIQGTFGSQLRIQESAGTYFDIAAGGRFDIKNNAGTAVVSIAQSGSPVGSVLNITTAGLVGIGTTTPATLLQVGDSSVSSGSAQLRVYGFDGAADFYNTREEGPFNATIQLHNNPTTSNPGASGITFRARSSSTDSRVQATIYSTWTTSTDATRTSALIFQTVNSGTASSKFTIAGNGSMRFNSYGSGSFTGTRAYDLSVDASGNIIEVPIGAGTITGSGTTNYIPKFTSSSAIGNSIIYESGGSIGINTISPNATLEVNGSFNSTDGTSTIRITNSGGLGLFGTVGSHPLVFRTVNTERMRITSDGSVGIGSTSLTGYNLRVEKNLTGSTTSTGIASFGQIQSDATANARYFSSQSSQAAGFTTTNIQHYHATQGTLLGTVTNQIAFNVASTLTGGVSNFAFKSDLDAGNNRWNLYMNGTANNYLAGSLGIGTTSLTGYGLRVLKSITGATTSLGIVSDGAIQADVTNTAAYFRSVASASATPFALTDLAHFQATTGSLGSASITSQYGFLVASSMTGASNNFAFYGNLAAASGRWNLYMNGTANNYLAGSLGIGTTSPTGLLHLYGADPAFRIQSSTTGNMQFGQWDATNNRIQSSGRDFYLVGTDSYATIFGTNNTERMRITSGGAVGIGTTNPTANGLMIEKTGNHLYLRASSAAAGKYWNFDVTAANQLYIINNAGTQYLTITDGGNAGINEVNPVNKLSIKGGNGNQLGLNNSGERFTQISFANNGSQQAAIWYDNTDNDFVIHAAAGKSVVFQTNGSNERMRVNSGGNVLIGTTTDSGFKLDVNGTGIVRGKFNVSANISDYTATFVNTNSSSYGIYIQAGGTYPAIDVYNYNATSLLASLKGNGQLRLAQYTSTSSFPGTAAGFIGFDSSGNLITVASAGGVSGSGTTNYVARWTASTTLGTGVLYDNGTNVGVNTTSPYAGTGVTSLTVNATAYAVMALYVGGTFEGGVIGYSDHIDLYSEGYLNFETLGSEKMRITTGGNIGIGTTNPQSYTNYRILHLSAPVTTGGALLYMTNSDSSVRGLAMAEGNLSAIVFGSQSNHPVQFWSNDSERMRISNSGNVGIGTTAPSTLLHLQSAASTTTLRIDNTNSSNDAAILLTDNNNPTGEGLRITYDSSVGDTYFNNIYQSSTNAFHFQKGDFGSGTTLMMIKMDGNVGIGTTSPTQLLHVLNSSADAEKGVIISNVYAGTSADASLRIDGYAGSYIDFYRNAGARWRFQRIAFSDDFKITASGGIGDVMYFKYSDGNVGIGTTTPGQKLVVNGGAWINQTSDYFGAGTTVQISAGGTGSVGVQSNIFYLYPYSSNTNARLIYGYNGNYSWELTNTSGNSRFDFISSTTTVMSLLQAGSVSIGSTSPDGRLYVERTATWSSGNLLGTNTVQYITYGSGASTGTVAISAVGAFQQVYFSGSATIGNGGRHGAIDSILTIGNTSSGTITVSQSSTLRAMSSISAATYFNPGSSTTITHLAGIRVLPDINTGAGAITVTNKYGVLIGDASGGSGSITYTTRWGIYQEGASDNNYFAAKVLIGTTTATSDALYVNGTAYINNNMTVNGTVTELSSANYKRNISTLENTLEKVDKMRAVSYNRVGGIKKEIGLIAEEVEQVYPEFVEYDNNGRPMGLNYARLTAVLLQSIKELNGRINELENRN